MPSVPQAAFLLPLGTLLLLSACGASTGVHPVGPGIYAVSEMRAEALGGGPSAQQAVLRDAAGFCQQQGLAPLLMGLQPGGDPRGRYWPTAFTATFGCVPRGGGTGT